MRQVHLVGMGVGHRDQLTVQAVTALRQAQRFFIVDKGAPARALVDVRSEILRRHVPGRHDVSTIADPDRDRSPQDYEQAVANWHRARAERYEEALAELDDDGVGAFLIWGDPGLYDSTLRILEQVRDRGRVTFDITVVPGVSAIQALTAAFAVPLNRVGAPVHITTGRRLRDEGMTADDVVVLLDGAASWQHVDPTVEILWGAYLGTDDELLVRGRVGEVGPDIVRTRADARARHGWIMDTYLLRRSPTG